MKQAAAVTTATDTDNWRKKYFDSLGALETEQRQFRATEAVLKRLAGRLCTASLGLSPRLDDEIKKLQRALRREATVDELDQMTPALTDAIQSLDQPVAAPPPVVAAKTTAVTQSAKAQPEPPREAGIEHGRVRAILAALLDELRRDPELLEQVDALDARLTASMTLEQLPDVLSSLSEIIGQRIQRIERSKQEIEVLLGQMVGKLDEIGQFVIEQNQNQSQSHASSETLNVQLVGEIKAMGESVESAGDLQQIRSQVRARLESIDKHWQEFRKRESTLASVMSASNEKMRERVAELEAEAGRLNRQLKDEQRLSTLDVLTKIPNRLAYDKRIEEELSRWQRFKQPTCVAVWDVDRFKHINDTYGHRAGDKVLSVVAGCLANRVRSTDFLARYGGEEFVMILSGTKPDAAVRMMDEMRLAIAEIGFHFRGAPVSVTISSGVTALLVGDTTSSAFDRADRAMYQAKESGRNRCVAG